MFSLQVTAYQKHLHISTTTTYLDCLIFCLYGQTQFLIMVMNFATSHFQSPTLASIGLLVLRLGEAMNDEAFELVKKTAVKCQVSKIPQPTHYRTPIPSISRVKEHRNEHTNLANQLSFGYYLTAMEVPPRRFDLEP